MRWFLAALAFALLVALAVFTVAIRTKNLAARARIAKHNDQILSLRVEKSQRELTREARPTPAELRQRIRRLVGGPPVE